MYVLRFRPIVVTFLLILVYGSGWLFLTSLTVVSMSILVTFFCFIFKIQIDFETLFSFIEKFRKTDSELSLWNAALGARSLDGDNGNNGRKSMNDKGFPRVTSIGTLKDLPRPIARKLKLIIDGVMNEFVNSWYIEICPEDQQFSEETRRALEAITVEGYKRICNMDTHSAAVKLINLLTAHLKIFSDCRDAVNSKYPGINAVDFERCITELYEARIVQHISAKSQGTALDYLRKITDILMFVLVPQNAFSCEGGRFMLREIIAIQGLQHLVELLSDPHFVNKALIDIFEEALPIEAILQQWREESLKELTADDEEKVTGDHDKLSNEKEDRVESDSYESASESGVKSFTKPKSSSQRTKNSSYSSIEHLNEILDNIDLKFATPRHSTTEWSSAEESYDAFDRVLRQNQLEAKSSAPVYGSTMVKLHEKSGQSQMQFQIPVSNPVPSAIISKADSGVYSDTFQVRGPLLPLSQVVESDEKNSKGGTRKNRPKSKHYKQVKKQGLQSGVDDDIQSKVLSLNGDNLAEPWTSCHPPDSNYYRKVSYKEMDRRQDLPREQFKAKLHAIGSKVGEVSCMKSVLDRKQTRKHKSLPNLMNSFEASMVICQPSDFNIDNEERDSDMIDKAVFNETDHTITDGNEKSFVRVHYVPERNAFYQVAPDCPTCIEMTSLANPIENGKAVLTFEPKQNTGKKEGDHECGLSISHFYHPELECNNVLKDDDDNESFISFDSNDSLTDLEDPTSALESESTLLASSESIGLGDSSVELVDKRKVTRQKAELKSNSVGSFDVVSLKESDSEFSSATGFDADDLNQDDSYDSQDNFNRRESNMNVTRGHTRAESITTFASAFDSSTHDHDNHPNATTPSTSKKPATAPFGSILKHFRSSTSIKYKKHRASKTEFRAKILKSLKELTSKKHAVRKDDSSDEEEEEEGDGQKSNILNKASQTHGKRKKISAKKADPVSREVMQHRDIFNKEEQDSSFSGILKEIFLT